MPGQRAITSYRALTARSRAVHQEWRMANLSEAEFGRAMQALVDHYGLERLRDRLAKMGAFTSRRGLNTPSALADRLYRLSGGLRRQAMPSFAFTTLWGEMLQAKLGEDGEKRLEQLADKVNACLTTDERIIEGKDEDLDRALAEYNEALTAAAGAEVARADMLLKAVPAVAGRLRTGESGS
jgi:hypothetical protein